MGHRSLKRMLPKMARKQKKVTLSVQIDADLKAWLETKAGENGTPVDYVVQRMVFLAMKTDVRRKELMGRMERSESWHGAT